MNVEQIMEALPHRFPFLLLDKVITLTDLYAEGVKNVWDKMKEKVTSAVGAVKDAYQTLKDNAKDTWDDIKQWNDERQQEDIKAKMKYAADKWGKDKVSSWIDEL